jgi:putative ABC transport system permease protein
MKQFAVIAFRNLLSHKARTLILGGAIALVTAMMTVMLAVTRGIKSRMIENATALSTGHVNVGGFLKISQSSAAPVLNKVSRIREVVAREVPEAALLVERVRAFGKIISDEASIMVPMTGIDIEKEKSILGNLSMANKADYVDGWVAKPGEAEVEGSLEGLKDKGSIAIFASHAKKLKIRVGDTVTLSMPTYRNIYNTKDVKVVGVLQNLGLISSFSVFLNHKDTQEIYDLGPDTSSVVQVYLNSLQEVPGVENRLRIALSKAGYALMDKDANPFWMKFDRVAGESWTGQKLDVTTWEDETSFLKWILDIFGALTFVLTIVLMVIVVIGLMNNMWMAIRERTAEIGTMRALGLQRGGVLQMFVLESLMLATLSVGAGLILGALAASALSALHIPIRSEAFIMFLMSNSLYLRVSGADLLLTFVLLSTLLMLGALVPAYRASKMSPIAAINHVQ